MLSKLVESGVHKYMDRYLVRNIIIMTEKLKENLRAYSGDKNILGKKLSTAKLEHKEKYLLENNDYVTKNYYGDEAYDDNEKEEIRYNKIFGTLTTTPKIKALKLGLKIIKRSYSTSLFALKPSTSKYTCRPYLIVKRFTHYSSNTIISSRTFKLVDNNFGLRKSIIYLDSLLKFNRANQFNNYYQPLDTTYKIILYQNTKRQYLLCASYNSKLNNHNSDYKLAKSKFYKELDLPSDFDRSQLNFMLYFVLHETLPCTRSIRAMIVSQNEFDCNFTRGQVYDAYCKKKLSLNEPHIDKALKKITLENISGRSDINVVTEIDITFNLSLDHIKNESKYQYDLTAIRMIHKNAPGSVEAQQSFHFTNQYNADLNMSAIDKINNKPFNMIRDIKQTESAAIDQQRCYIKALYCDVDQDQPSFNVSYDPNSSLDIYDQESHELSPKASYLTHPQTPYSSFSKFLTSFGKDVDDIITKTLTVMEPYEQSHLTVEQFVIKYKTQIAAYDKQIREYDNQIDKYENKKKKYDALKNKFETQKKKQEYQEEFITDLRIFISNNYNQPFGKMSIYLIIKNTVSPYHKHNIEEIKDKDVKHFNSNALKELKFYKSQMEEFRKTNSSIWLNEKLTMVQKFALADEEYTLQSKIDKLKDKLFTSNPNSDHPNYTSIPSMPDSDLFD